MYSAPPAAGTVPNLASTFAPSDPTFLPGLSDAGPPPPSRAAPPFIGGWHFPPLPAPSPARPANTSEQARLLVHIEALRRELAAQRKVADILAIANATLRQRQHDGKQREGIYAAKITVLEREVATATKSLADGGEREKKLANDVKAARAENGHLKKRKDPHVDRAPSDFKWADTRLPPHAAFAPPAGFAKVTCKSKSLNGKAGLQKKLGPITDQLQVAIDETVRLKKRDAVIKLSDDQRRVNVQHALATGTRGSKMKDPADGSQVNTHDVCELGRVAANNEMILATDALAIVEELQKENYYLALELRHAQGWDTLGPTSPHIFHPPSNTRTDAENRDSRRQAARGLGLATRMTEIFGGRQGFTRWWAWVGAAEFPGGHVWGKYRCVDSKLGAEVYWETPRVRKHLEKLRRRVHIMTPSAQNTGLRCSGQTQRNMTFTRAVADGQVWGATELQQSKYRAIDYRNSVVPKTKAPAKPFLVNGDDSAEGREERRKALAAASADAEARAAKAAAQEELEREMIKSEALKEVEAAMAQPEREVEPESEDEADDGLAGPPKPSLLSNYESIGRAPEVRLKEAYAVEADNLDAAVLAVARWRYGAPMPFGKACRGTLAASADAAVLKNIQSNKSKFTVFSKRWVNAGGVGEALTERRLYNRIFKDCGSALPPLTAALSLSCAPPPLPSLSRPPFRVVLALVTGCNNMYTDVVMPGGDGPINTAQYVVPFLQALYHIEGTDDEGYGKLRVPHMMLLGPPIEYDLRANVVKKHPGTHVPEARAHTRARAEYTAVAGRR